MEPAIDVSSMHVENLLLEAVERRSGNTCFASAGWPSQKSMLWAISLNDRL
jgi:hypothetical protein